MTRILQIHCVCRVVELVNSILSTPDYIEYRSYRGESDMLTWFR
jgi:hypothetical protein